MSSNISNSKRKFLQNIERKVYDLTNNRIKEQVVDFTVLYLRRNNIRHTPEDLNNILEVFKMAMEDSYMKNIDSFLGTVDKDLDTLVEAVDPLDSTDSRKSSGTMTVAGTVREESAPKKPTKVKKGTSSLATSKSR